MHTKETQLPGPNYWLIVERIENWHVDRNTNFKHFGLSRLYEKRAKKIQKDDLLIGYVSSGISCFVGIRRVTSDKLGSLRFGGDYDAAYPICINTESIVSLDRRHWVPIKEMVNQLCFTANSSDWRQLMRSSLRALSEKDGKILIKRLQEASSGTA